MVASSPELELFGNKIIRSITEVKKELTKKGLAKFTQEFDTFENFLTKKTDYFSNRI
jgi:hypothetical protein